MSLAGGLQTWVSKGTCGEVAQASSAHPWQQVGTGQDGKLQDLLKRDKESEPLHSFSEIRLWNAFGWVWLVLCLNLGLASSVASDLKIAPLVEISCLLY